ncbi:MAG: DUF1636 domain-containing protein [Cyanobacteria bacterium J06639_18]
MEAQHTMFVCTTCASVWENGKRIGESGGEKLFQQLQREHQNWELKGSFAIAPVKCMSACNRSCTISFASPGKSTYLFGDLSSELSEQEVTGVFECASKYYTHTEGLLPWAERSEPLKKGILAKIPAPVVTAQIEKAEMSVTA